MLLSTSKVKLGPFEPAATVWTPVSNPLDAEHGPFKLPSVWTTRWIPSRKVKTTVLGVLTSAMVVLRGCRNASS